MKNNNQLSSKTSNQLTRHEQDVFQFETWNKPLVVQQADEIVLLQNTLADAKSPAQLKRRLLELKRRMNDPAWHTHLCGR
jgi:hypothetical protein